MCEPRSLHAMLVQAVRPRPAVAFRSSLKRRFLSSVTPILLLLLGAAASGHAHLTGPNGQANQGFQPVAPGVEHLKMIRGSTSQSEETGPWVINLLRLDLKQVSLRIAHALDEGVGLETTSSMATRASAIAAVNAGFFRTAGTYRGEPSGVLAIGGDLLSEPIEGRAAFGLINSRASSSIVFGHLKFSGFIESASSYRKTINGLNRPRGNDELIVYTPAFHRTTLTNPGGIELIVERNRVVRIRDREGSSVIPSSGFVLSAAGKARESLLENLRRGSRVRIRTRLIPIERDQGQLWKQAAFTVGGGPQLIMNSRIAITTESEGIAARFASDRHPRTAIAKLEGDKILLATVDGRQPGVSAGMSLPQLASLLLEFGALEAINLDGGGSTTMVIKGKVVNTPSDQTGERPIGDAILVVPRALHSKPGID